MNHGKKTDSTMHFKSAQISGVEISPNDMAQINRYALSPLSPEDVFAFKVSMAANEVDRDFEVFPRHTLSKLANLFVGKTVVKDHEHRSDNQIARIFGTELVESQPTRVTRAGEVHTELIAKCYMVKTGTNADLIAEIRAGIRKEVSLGCRIGKAVCSICGTDNVKTYCIHFPGKKYEGEICHFSLEDASDAYELSFVAIPAQQHAGTVKSYGGKPCRQEEMEAGEKAAEPFGESMGAEEGERPSDDPESAAGSADMPEKDGKSPENARNEPQIDAKEAVSAPKEQENDAQIPADEPVPEGDQPEEHGPVRGESRLTVNRFGDGNDPDEREEGENQKDSPEKDYDRGADAEKRQALNQLWEAAKRLMPAPTTEEQCHRIAELFLELEKRLTVNQEPEEAGQAETPIQGSAVGEERQPAQEEAEEALKAKQAQARLRALELALSLRKRD